MSWGLRDECPYNTRALYSSELTILHVQQWICHVWSVARRWLVALTHHKRLCGDREESNLAPSSLPPPVPLTNTGVSAAPRLTASDLLEEQSQLLVE